MARRYAQESTVPTSRTRAEIEELLGRFGAGTFGVLNEPERALVAFELKGRRIRIIIPLPDRTARQFTHTPQTNKLRSAGSAQEAYEQACRSSWRALLLVIRAKLEAIEIGISTFEHEFLAHIVMPDGLTVADHTVPKIQQAYEHGETPPLLPAPGGFN